jgi:outer membrane protein TolC
MSLVGYELSDGLYVNLDRNTPSNGLAKIGLSIPLVQGLITDERRIEIQKAQIMIKANENEKQLIINNLLFDASIVYLNWTKSEFAYQLYQQSLQYAKERMSGMVGAFEQGDKSVLDTLEANLIYRDRLLMLKNMEMERQSQILKSSVFL